MAFRWWLTATTNQTQKRVITIQRRWLIMPQKKKQPPHSTCPNFYTPSGVEMSKTLRGFGKFISHYSKIWNIFVWLLLVVVVVFVLTIYCDSLIAMNIYVWRLDVACEDVNKLENSGGGGSLVLYDGTITVIASTYLSY